MGWVIINNRRLFLIVLETGKFKLKVPTDSVSSGLASWFIFLLSPPGKAKALSGAVCIRAPTMRASLSGLNLP